MEGLVGGQNLSSFHRVQPGIASFQQTGPRAFRFTYEWAVQDRLTKDYLCFVHFEARGAICAQQDHALSLPTSQWQPGQTKNDGPWDFTWPADRPDGDYDWLIGLYDAAEDGQRVALQGVDDGTLRIHLGVLHVAQAGAVITFSAETNRPTFDPGAWYAQHLNNSNRVVDFGGARTDGSLWLHRDGQDWVLQTWPRARSFTLELDRKRFAQPTKVVSSGGSAAEIIPIDAGPRWRLPLNGASEYRWPSEY